jgi:hypothetical protein
MHSVRRCDRRHGHATLADAAGKDFFLVYEYTSGPSTKGNGNATSVR